MTNSDAALSQNLEFYRAIGARDLSAMDHYYENGPLPTWAGWYVHQLGHPFHAVTAGLTLIVELGLVWIMFFGRRARLVCFVVVTLLQVGIIATAMLTDYTNKSISEEYAGV